MSLKLSPVLLTTSMQSIFEAGIGTEASVHGLVFTNNTDTQSSFSINIFDKSTNTTINLAQSIIIFGRTSFAWPRPINMEEGDILSCSAALNDTITVAASIYTDEISVKLGFTPRGIWISSASYSQNDVVTYNNSSYVASTSNTNLQPDTNTGSWTLLSSVGFTGSRGDTGFTGSQGVIGFTGSQGVIGFTGSKGDTGFTGSQGVVGFTGSKGDTGFAGSQGVIGFTGSQGVIGFTGSRGDVGFTGSLGFTGSTGIYVSASTPPSPNLYDIWLDIT
jgi:hypothetical protein